MSRSQKTCTDDRSVLVHAADAYLHIATEAVQMIQIFPQAQAHRRYGRSIDP